MRPVEIGLVVALLLAVILAALAGIRRAPSPELADPRLSTELAGPMGASGLAETLERLGVSVVQRRRPLFDLSADPRARDGSMLALLAVARSPTAAERMAVTRFLLEGGTLLLVGPGTVAGCLGYSVESLEYTDAESRQLVVPEGIGELPEPTAVLTPLSAGSSPQGARSDAPSEGPGCRAPKPSAVDTLLALQDGRPVALRLSSGGGRAILVADPTFFRNLSLKETDAGALVVPWLLNERPDPVIADEYHQGFGVHGSIWRAAGRWLVSNPAGWMLLQLGAAGLLALVLAAVRFGPARRLLTRTRRSSLEHVEALAAGLQRAAGEPTAIDLLVQGLRRRLRGGSRDPSARYRADFDPEGWLAGLNLAVENPDARDAARRLRVALQQTHHDDEQVLEIARTVEELWTALGQASRRNGS